MEPHEMRLKLDLARIELTRKERKIQNLKRVLKKLHDACVIADTFDELSEYVDGSLLDAAKKALEK